MSTWTIERPAITGVDPLHRLGGRGATERVNLPFQDVDAVEQMLDGLGYRVRQVRLVEVDARGHPLAVAVRDLSGNPDDHGVGGHVAHHHRARAYAAPVADGDGSEHGGTGPHDNVVPQRGVALLPPQARTAQGHPLKQGDVLADLGRLPDHHTHAVVNEEALTQASGRMDLDTGQEARDMRREAGQGRPARLPQAMGHAMEGQSVHAGVA
jgi:hypothetical protein